MNASNQNAMMEAKQALDEHVAGILQDEEKVNSYNDYMNRLEDEDANDRAVNARCFLVAQISNHCLHSYEDNDLYSAFPPSEERSRAWKEMEVVQDDIRIRIWYGYAGGKRDVESAVEESRRVREKLAAASRAQKELQDLQEKFNGEFQNLVEDEEFTNLRDGYKAARDAYKASERELRRLCAEKFKEWVMANAKACVEQLKKDCNEEELQAALTSLHERLKNESRDTLKKIYETLDPVCRFPPQGLAGAVDKPEDMVQYEAERAYAEADRIFHAWAAVPGNFGKLGGALEKYPERTRQKLQELQDEYRNLIGEGIGEIGRCGVIQESYFVFTASRRQVQGSLAFRFDCELGLVLLDESLVG